MNLTIDGEVSQDAANIWAKKKDKNIVRKCFLSPLVILTHGCFVSAHKCGNKKCKTESGNIGQHFKLIRIFSVDRVTMAKNSMFEYFLPFCGAFSWRIQMWLNLSFFLASSIYQYQTFQKKEEINSDFFFFFDCVKYTFKLTDDWWFIKHLNS